MGIGIQSIVGWWTVTDVDLQNDSKVRLLPMYFKFVLANELEGNQPATS